MVEARPLEQARSSLSRAEPELPTPGPFTAPTLCHWNGFGASFTVAFCLRQCNFSGWNEESSTVPTSPPPTLYPLHPPSLLTLRREAQEGQERACPETEF